MSYTAIVVAAGRGTRAGGPAPKQWQELLGKPVLAHTLALFRQAADCERIILVIHPDDRALAQSVAPDALLVEGGAERAQSVRNALEALALEVSDPAQTHVLIHDAARPCASPALITRMAEALARHKAAAPALAVTDALWLGADGLVQGARPRDGLYRAQTPQAFHLSAILDAHRHHQGSASDDVEVALSAGLDVHIIEGEEENLKLTWPQDFARAALILKGQAMDVRLGNGYDVHAFCEGDHVWLCGVKIPHDKGLLGHSDADVGMHALTDALYGALALGDIGRHFPPSDPQWKGAESHIFLRHAIAEIRARGYALSNCDVTLICERPKIGPHAAAMQAALAEIMGVEVERVSVKATTSERLGFTGREEGIAAVATACLIKA